MADAILTDESGASYSLENIKTQGWLDGHVSGLDAAVNWLGDRAVSLFRDGKYDDAKALRDMAGDMDRALRPGMEDRARRHEREFPMQIEVES